LENGALGWGRARCHPLIYYSDCLDESNGTAKIPAALNGQFRVLGKHDLLSGINGLVAQCHRHP